PRNVGTELPQSPSHPVTITRIDQRAVSPSPLQQIPPQPQPVPSPSPAAKEAAQPPQPAPAIAPAAPPAPSLREPETVVLRGGNFAMGSNDDLSERPVH